MDSRDEVDSFEIRLTAETGNNIVICHFSDIPFIAIFDPLLVNLTRSVLLPFVLVEISGFRLWDSHPKLSNTKISPSWLSKH